MNNQPDISEFLSVGLVAVIHVAGRADPFHRYITSIRGWRKDAFVTLDLPIVSSRYIPIKKDMECVLRFFSEGRACGFDAPVISVNASIENPYLQLAWPKKFECVTVRRFERVPTKIAGKVIFDDQLEKNCEIVDISAGGCRLLADFYSEPGDTIRLSFALPDATWLEDVKAYVRNVRKMAEHISMGCEFAPEEKAAQTSSGFYVSSTLERLRQADNSKVRLLLIEKDDAVVDVIRAALQPKGYEVISAKSIVDAFFRLKMLPPRALLLNYNLKDLPPLEICRLVRQTNDFDKLPIFIYGGKDPQLGKQGHSVGLTGYISSENMLYELAKALAETASNSST
ncbi:MAG TPA: PilZ domain-containing protein [Candidatus Hydrogenedentes bacterium]|nr:PilZ domain-containing protein [Candidatus Hydrogenedentota bacterium]HOL78252.1 PilZ domain-containing protein [Candidatus Hydrogenedentota bacterium]HPO86392.1 PilZ domain-containing protein [Candidatus Hydrogenedentota bacterium]